MSQCHNIATLDEVVGNPGEEGFLTADRAVGNGEKEEVWERFEEREFGFQAGHS